MATPQYDTPIGTGGAIDTRTGKILDGALAGQNAGKNDNAIGSTNSYSPAIPVGSFSAPAELPLNIKQPAPTTGSAGLAGAISAGTDQFTQNLAEQANAAKDPAQKGLSDLIQNMLNSEGATALTANEYANTGVDSSKSELKAINNRILAEQRAADNEIRLAKENPLGLSTEGVNRQIQDIQDKSVQRQADLAILQMAKQGQYDSAKEIADRAVAAKLERQKTINEALQLNYQELKDTFTKAEQRQFEVAQKDRERSLEMVAYKEKARYDQIIKQSDPLYRAQLSKASLELDALKNPSSVVGISKETADRMDKLPLTEKTALADANDTINQIDRLQELVTNNDIVTLQNPLSAEGILFNRLSSDIADKLARKRTGAVVNPSEEATFKKILGLGFFTRLNSDKETVSSELQKFKNVHESVATLIDPRGDIRQALKANTESTQEDAYVNNVTSALGGGSDSISTYLNSFNPK